MLLVTLWVREKEADEEMKKRAKNDSPKERKKKTIIYAAINRIDAYAVINYEITA